MSGADSPRSARPNDTHIDYVGIYDFLYIVAFTIFAGFRV